MQIGSSARAQSRQWLMPVQLRRKVSRCASMNGSKCNGPELESDSAADAVGQWHWNDVELELPHGQVSSGHADDGRSCAERCRGADCYSSRDAHRRCSLRQIWQHRVRDVGGCGAVRGYESYRN